MMEPLIAFDGYSFTYADAEEPALHDVSLTVDEGEYVALLGLNGAGKTTLGLSLNGVVPSMLQGETSGTLRVAGVEPIDYPVREMAKLVGVVFDNPEFQMSQLSAAEEVALGLENVGTPQDEMRGTVHEMLDLVGLRHCADRSPLTLSGGQQQRLAIASVLAMRPRLLFMDEPTSNLDPAGKDEVFGIARWLNQDRGMTVVVAEHEVEVLARYATRVVVLDHGRIVLNGPPRDVLTQVDVLRSLGLRPPQVTEVAHETDCWRGDVPVTTEQAVAEIGRMLAVS